MAKVAVVLTFDDDKQEIKEIVDTAFTVLQGLASHPDCVKVVLGINEFYEAIQHTINLNTLHIGQTKATTYMS